MLSSSSVIAVALSADLQWTYNYEKQSRLSCYQISNLNEEKYIFNDETAQRVVWFDFFNNCVQRK